MKRTASNLVISLCLIMLLGCESQEARKQREDDHRFVAKMRQQEEEKRNAEELRWKQEAEQKEKAKDELETRFKQMHKDAVAVENPIIPGAKPPRNLTAKHLILSPTRTDIQYGSEVLAQLFPAPGKDAERTLFLVTEEWLPIGTANYVTRIPGSNVESGSVTVALQQHQATIRIVAWPSKKALGGFQVKGPEPGRSTTVAVDREGKLVDPSAGKGQMVSVTEWVQNCYSKQAK